MGITRFSGPTYGAKSLLWQVKQEAGIVSTAVQTVAQLVIPSYQDWLVTEVHAYKTSTASTNFVVTLSDDSTRLSASTRTIATVTLNSSLGAQAGSTTPAGDAGEYEGVRIAGLSTVTLQLQQSLSSAAALASSGVFAWVYGYIRYVDSTRAV